MTQAARAIPANHLIFMAANPEFTLVSGGARYIYWIAARRRGEILSCKRKAEFDE
jgi:hypothetical protein|tara:strand:- start:794 stop:958 length:165 start_codon:yes stop_codon:yes gene_type:complete